MLPSAREYAISGVFPDASTVSTFCAITKDEFISVVQNFRGEFAQMFGDCNNKGHTHAPEPYPSECSSDLLVTLGWGFRQHEIDPDSLVFDYSVWVSGQLAPGHKRLSADIFTIKFLQLAEILCLLGTSDFFFL